MVFAVADLITLVTGISAFAKAAETVGVKEAASYMGKQFMVELSADASAAGVAAIGGDQRNIVLTENRLFSHLRIHTVMEGHWLHG